MGDAQHKATPVRLDRIDPSITAVGPGNVPYQRETDAAAANLLHAVTANETFEHPFAIFCGDPRAIVGDR